MNRFCSNCGSETEIDAAFCQTCGFKIELLKNDSLNQSSLFESENDFKQQYSDNFQNNQPKKIEYKVIPLKKGTNMRTAGFFIVLLVILSVSLLGLSQFSNLFNFNFNDYTYIGDKSFTSSKGNFSSISFDLEISSGEINIDTVSSQDSPVKAVVQIFATNPYQEEINEANNLVEEISGDRLTISFKENTSPFQIVNEPFSYNLKITIVESFEYEFTTQSSSGNIKINLDQIFLKKLDITASSGSVNVGLSDSNITTDTVSINTSSGNLNLVITDNSFINTTVWDLFTSSGTISLDITHSNIPNKSFMQMFIIKASSGSIDITTSMDSSIGVFVTATSSSGSVFLFDDFVTSYESPNYGISAHKFEFDLEVSSGSITMT